MPAYPANVRSPGHTGSRRHPVKPTQMTLSRHSDAGGFMPLLKTGEIHRTWPREETCHARMQNQLLGIWDWVIRLEAGSDLSKYCTRSL